MNKSDWSKALTIACELDMINAIFAADIALSCQVQNLPGYQAPRSVLLRNRMAEHFASVSEDEDV